VTQIYLLNHRLNVDLMYRLMVLPCLNAGISDATLSGIVLLF
jgi:hypothetical protein